MPLCSQGGRKNHSWFQTRQKSLATTRWHRQCARPATSRRRWRPPPRRLPQWQRTTTCQASIRAGMREHGPLAWEPAARSSHGRERQQVMLFWFIVSLSSLSLLSPYSLLSHIATASTTTAASHCCRRRCDAGGGGKRAKGAAASREQPGASSHSHQYELLLESMSTDDKVAHISKVRAHAILPCRQLSCHSCPTFCVHDACVPIVIQWQCTELLGSICRPLMSTASLPRIA